MVTYDEFMKENSKVKNLEQLHLGVILEESAKYYESEIRAAILENPNEYLDIAQNSQNLKEIVIDIDKTSNIHDRQWYKGVREFVKNCNDDIKINSGNLGHCTKEEFFKGEEIIESIADEINPNWNIKQKLAFVHFKIGELVSYMPEYNARKNSNTPENSKYIADRKNIWKALASGVSVCNGIVEIERAILTRVGVNTKALKSNTHTYLLAEDKEGNILSDPTWDEKYTTFGCKPQFLGKTYEELRKVDGPFCNAHKLNEVPDNVISISDEELRQIYHSIGIIEEDKKFKPSILDISMRVKEKEFTTKQENIEYTWKLINSELSDKFHKIEECKGMFEDCLAWSGADRNKIESQYIYSNEDTKFENPYLIVNVAMKNNENITKIIDPREDRILDISIDEVRKRI